MNARSLLFWLLPLCGLAGCATEPGRPYTGGVYLYDYDPYWSFYYEPFYWPYDWYCGGLCGGYYYGWYPVVYGPPRHPYPGPGWPHPPWHGGLPYPAPGGTAASAKPPGSGFHRAPLPLHGPSRPATRPAAPVRPHPFSRSRRR